MSTYPMLNNRPIDQWMVTELKDELQRRNLPVSGLKDDLVKRLFEAIKDKILNDGEKTNGGIPAEELKGDETPSSVDASVDQASIKELVDEDASEVMKQGADLVISITEACDESTLATSEVTQEAVVVTAEASQRSLYAVAEVESSLVDTAATDGTNGNGLESASSGDSIVEEANPPSDNQCDTIEQTREDDTNKKLSIDDIPSDGTGGDVKLGLNMHRKILEMEDVPAPPDDTVLHGDHEDADAVVAAEPEDDTSKKIAIDSVLSDANQTTVKLGVKVDCKIEQEEVPAMPDAIELHADPEDVEAIVVAELEDDKSKKMAIDGVLSNANHTTVKLGVKVDCKIEHEEVPTMPDAIELHADPKDADAVVVSEPEDADVVVAAESEDDTSKKMIIDGVLSDANHTTINLGVKVDCKLEHEEVLPQAIELNADPKDADVVVAAENMIPKDNFNVNTLMYGNGHGDLKCSNGDTKPFVCREKDQLAEVNLDLDSQTKCASMFDDNISADKNNDLKDNLNGDDCDLELEAKQEMVKSSPTIPSPSDHFEVLDVNKKVHKNGATLQELGSTSNIDLDRDQESPDGSSIEKLNFDRSSGDESMDEDVLESKNTDSNIKSDDPREKTEFISEHVLKEVSLLDTAAEDSSAHTKQVVAEEKPPNPAEKRKPEDQEVIATNEPIKRQRIRNVDAVDISDQQAPKLTGTGTPKGVFHSAPSRSFGRPDTTTSSGYAKERIVPPAQKPATVSLRIDRFVRPFTLKAVQELLGKTGSVCSFWMDLIKTHCYVTYSSVEEAVATRNAVYNLQWPPNNRNYLVAGFVDPEEVKLKLEAPPPSQVPISLSTATTPQAAPFQQPNANQSLPSQPAAALLPTPAPLAKLPPTSGSGPAREMLMLPPSPRNLEPPRTLDDLFKKTQAYPRVYYMPLSEEEVSAKLQLATVLRGDSGALVCCSSGYFGILYLSLLFLE